MSNTRLASQHAGWNLFVLLLASSVPFLAKAQMQVQAKTQRAETMSIASGRGLGPHDSSDTATLCQPADPTGRRLSTVVGTKMTTCVSVNEVVNDRDTFGITFQAPVDITITGLNVPYTTGSRTSQSFQVILSQEPFPVNPSKLSLPSATAETVLYEKGVSANKVFSVNIPVEANTYVGILAKTMDGSTSYTEYCFNQAAARIEGNIVMFDVLRSSGMLNLNDQQATQLARENLLGSGGVVDVFYSLTTASPSAFPSNSPSHIPTSVPSSRPSLLPSTSPTGQPTKKPTMRPTMKPTMRPTMKPTMRPTKKPTMRPTMKPTKRPTMKPTLRPTKKPAVNNSVTDCFAMAVTGRLNCCLEPVNCAGYLREQCRQVYKDAGRDLTKFKARTENYVGSHCSTRN